MQSRQVLSSPHLPFSGGGEGIEAHRNEVTHSHTRSLGQKSRSCLSPLCHPACGLLFPRHCVLSLFSIELAVAASLLSWMSPSHLIPLCLPPLALNNKASFFFFPRKGFSFSFSFFFSRKYLCFLELASTEQHHQGNSCVSASAWLFAWSILVLSPLFALHYS